MPKAPCRLFVYLARDSPTAVVLRRGPTDWARLSLWHTDSDRFEHGQWLKGRVYERRSDLSADGSLFAAFIRQSGGRDPHRDTWIAVSRPPFFSALAVWFVGGTYHTGAFFPGRASLWLGFSPDTAPDIGQLPPWLSIAPSRGIAHIDGTSEWTERTVHFNRLIRDGWTLLESEPYRTVWERRHPDRPLALHMLHSLEQLQGAAGGRYVADYSVSSEADTREQVIGQATWADWDQRGRLVVARQGKLYQWQREAGALEEIADFNGHEPDPQPAPDAANAWPAPPRAG